jgi:hypothetical protein
LTIPSAKAVPLAFNAIARPLSPEEPLPRKILISQKKFLAEASPTIHLSENKMKAWSSTVDKLSSE